MKKIILMGLFVILASLFAVAGVPTGSVVVDEGVPVGSPMPYPIYGKVTVDNEDAGGMQVNIENMRTDEVLKMYTEYGGEFVTDPSHLKEGWRGSDMFEITYCIVDSRCDRYSQTFELEGVSKYLPKDLEGIYNGLTSPFLVYGCVTIDGLPVMAADISITNEFKEYSKTMETDGEGCYEYDISKMGIYDTGDLISVIYSNNRTDGMVTNKGKLQLDIGIVREIEEEEEPTPEPEPGPPGPPGPEGEEGEPGEPGETPGVGWLIAFGVVIVIIIIYLIYKARQEYEYE